MQQIILTLNFFLARSAAWSIAGLLILCTQTTVQAADTTTPKLLFENDRVKVWTLSLEPGQSTPVHTHELEEIVICLESSKIKILTPGPEPESQVVYPTAGAAFAPAVKGVTHILTNAGEKRYRQISIELK
jgi:beta-alanine degradation protein BauB